MIAIPCTNCSRMIDIDTSIYLDVIAASAGVMCSNCTKEHKINERDKKLKKVLRRGLIERIKFMIR
jgi:hypothetical protein